LEACFDGPNVRAVFDATDGASNCNSIVRRVFELARLSQQEIGAKVFAAPMFVYNLQPDNTCVYPAHVRFLLQEKGDDLSGTNGKQYFRW
jgi:hypothetical protein